MRILLLPALCLTSLFAQTNEQKARRVIDDAVAAFGGEKFLAMKDRVESGRAYSFYHEKLSGLGIATIYTRYLMRPDAPAPHDVLLRERQSFGKDERSGAVLFAGDQGYQITFRGARPLPQERIDLYRETLLHNILYILRMRVGEAGLLFDYKSFDIVDNVPVDIIDITDQENLTVTVSFERSTHLPLRQLYYRRDPKTRERNEEITIFSKYRDVGGGVQWPFAIQRLRNGEQVFQIYSDTVEINKGLTDDLFTLPAGMKILPMVK
jgi:hypothetical protein